MAELTPMMQQYMETKNSIRTAFFFIAWVIFTRCFLKMR